MKPMNASNAITRLITMAIMLAILLSATAFAAAPGITGTSGTAKFDLTAKDGFITQPDGQSHYSWGYGCLSGSSPTYAPFKGFCSEMQIPGPTLIVIQGTPVTVTLTNKLPSPAGNTSLLFPGFNVTAVAAATQPATCTVTTAAAQAPQGLLATEASPGCAVTYTFTADTPGTRAYYSGTQSDLQVEMGLYGAIIVLPNTTPTGCYAVGSLPAHYIAPGNSKEQDFRLAASAYNNSRTCYDREYLFQFSEMDPRIHKDVEDQVQAIANCSSANGNVCPTSLSVATEPYRPSYFMINGRSMPDDMDPNYSPQYPNQPYNGNPHMHPGELTLLRIIGQGRWQHPFHEHGNHVRILARDGNLIVSQSDTTSLAGPLLFTTTTTPGQAMDGIFYWTAKGLNWDAYGHNPKSSDPLAKLSCTPDANGYNTGDTTALNYYEWCQDHNKPLQVTPIGDVGAGGPATLPDPNILTNGPWYGGSPYLGSDATVRAVGTTGTTPPSGTIANSPSGEAGFSFMWHSHNEREITTNNAFPGGMLMMMLVDSREFVIDETN